MKKATPLKKEIPHRGGTREGSGRPKLRTKRKAYSFKLKPQAIHTLNRLAKARACTRRAALEACIFEHEATLNKEHRVFTWGGEQDLLAAD